MESIYFDQLVTQLSQTTSLPDALAILKSCDAEEVKNAAESLSGHFSIAEVNGIQKIYHVFSDLNDQGENEEFAEHIMDLDDDIMLFVSWFFYTQFDIKNSDTYAAAGKTYKQPKKNGCL